MPYTLHLTGEGVVPPHKGRTRSNANNEDMVHRFKHWERVFELSLYCLSWIFSSTLQPTVIPHQPSSSSQSQVKPQQLAFLPGRLPDTTSNPPASRALVRVLQTSRLAYPSMSPLSSSLPGFKSWPGQRRSQSVETPGFSSHPGLC